MPRTTPITSKTLRRTAGQLREIADRLDRCAQDMDAGPKPVPMVNALHVAGSEEGIETLRNLAHDVRNKVRLAKRRK